MSANMQEADATIIDALIDIFEVSLTLINFTLSPPVFGPELKTC